MQPWIQQVSQIIAEQIEGSHPIHTNSCQIKEIPMGVPSLQRVAFLCAILWLAGTHFLYTSEACLSGYAGTDFDSFSSFDWALLRRETAGLWDEAARLGLWLVLGSNHFLDEGTPPANRLYLFDPSGRLVDRYDKCMCTRGDHATILPASGWWSSPSMAFSWGWSSATTSAILSSTQPTGRSVDLRPAQHTPASDGSPG